MEISLKKTDWIRVGLLSILFLLGIALHAQDQKISIQIRNATVKDLIKQIESKTSYTVVYRDVLIDDKKDITINETNKPLIDILKVALSPKGLQVVFYNNTIIITKKNVEPQITTKTKIVSGVVLDEKGQPVIGASVIIPETTIGVITDINGAFSIEAPNISLVRVSYIGYDVKYIEIKGSLHLKITLTESLKELDEVVIVGFGIQKKETVVGAISTIKSLDIKQSPVSNLSNALVGRLPGLIAIQHQGQPGKDESEIFIRGLSTLNSLSGQPLILVDGVERKFAQIDPSEVETISILKDASATAVYGVRGANGVILVTTKRGMEGAPKIDFSSQIGMQQPVRRPQVIDALTAAEMYDEAVFSDTGERFYTSEEMASIKRVMGGTASVEERLRFPNINWFDELTKKLPIQQQYNINVRGGTKSVKYFVSGGYLNQGSMFKSFPEYHGDRTYNSNFQYDRFNFRSNIDIDISKNFSASINLSGRVAKINSPATYDLNVDYAGILFQSLYGAGSLSAPAFYPGYGFASTGGTSNFIGDLSQGGFTNQTNNNIESSIILKYKLDFITKGLTARTNFSFDSNFSYGKSYVEKYPVYIRDWKITDRPVYNQVQSYAPLTFQSQSFSNDRRDYFEIGLDYSRHFNKHTIGGLLLYNQQEYRYNAVTPYVYQGIVGRITYDYSYKYLFEFNVGYNGSENFHKDKRFGLFPALSMGWVVSQEDFLKESKVISFLKIRGSYGEVGNDRLYIGSSLQRFLYLNDYINTGGYPFDRYASRWEPGVSEGRIANEDVTWERARKSNIAIETSFFERLIGFNLDLFEEKRDNILITQDQSTSSIVGAVLPAVNKGKTESKGFEMELNHFNKIGKFNYWFKSNYCFAHSNIVSIDEPPSLNSWLKKEGRPIGQNFGYNNLGLFQSEAEIDASPDQTFFGSRPMVGDTKFEDYNRDGVINSDDQHAIGFSSIPEITYGISFGGNFNSFDFSVLFQGVANVTKGFWREGIFAFSHGRALLPIHVGRWSPDNTDEQNANATYPRLHMSNAKNGHNMATSFGTNLFDGSYFRLKNLEIGYTLPKAWSNYLKISSIRIYSNGSNLLTWDKMKLLAKDPETSDTGSIYPQMQVFNIGFNIKF